MEPETPSTSGSARAVSLDALKGLIMVVMALDHVRSFFMTYDGVKEIWYAPAIYNADAWNFWARYVSHLAAPGFFFMMGMGMVLFARSRQKTGWDANAIARSFVVRGLILVALQFLAEDTAWAIRSGNILRMFSTGVLSTLGLAMILSAFLLRFRPWIVIAVSVVCLMATQAVILGLNMEKGDYGLIPMFLVIAGQWQIVKINYPLIPWFGVTGLGIAFGWFWLADPARGYRWSLWGGLGLVVLFIAMRVWDDGFWNLRPQVDDSFWAFLQATKYPPSLSWLSLQMGVNFLFIWLFWKGEAIVETAGRVLIDYGRSPLFFYIVHLHLYGAMSFFVFNKNTGIVSMAAVWWVVGLAILWPLCRWYGGFKRSRHPDSFWRFL